MIPDERLAIATGDDIPLEATAAIADAMTAELEGEVSDQVLEGVLWATEGTRLRGTTLRQWLEAWEAIGRRRISSARYQAADSHLRALSDELVATATLPELAELDELVRSLDVPRGRRAGHPRTRLLDAIDRRRNRRPPETLSPELEDLVDQVLDEELAAQVVAAASGLDGPFSPAELCDLVAELAPSRVVLELVEDLVAAGDLLVELETVGGVSVPMIWAPYEPPARKCDAAAPPPSAIPLRRRQAARDLRAGRPCSERGKGEPQNRQARPVWTQGELPGLGDDAQVGRLLPARQGAARGPPRRALRGRLRRGPQRLPQPEGDRSQWQRRRSRSRPRPPWPARRTTTRGRPGLG